MAKHAERAPRRLAVLGSPIEHSASPALHAAAYGVLGLDWEYGRRDVRSGELGAFLGGLGPEWRGLSLTMPLKHEVTALATELDHTARLTGAANTVLFREGDGGRTISGFNTDVAGIVRALAEHGVTGAGHVSILGAGATAASALVAAAELGAEDVRVLARTATRAAPLVDLGRTVGLVVAVSELAEPPDPSSDSDLVISTLPGGVDLGWAFPQAIRESSTLLDVAYSPWPSALAQSWLDASGTVVPGIAMLVHQALVQVRIFVTGDPFEPLPNEDAVLEAMKAAADSAAGYPADRAAD